MRVVVEGLGGFGREVYDVILLMSEGVPRRIKTRSQECCRGPVMHMLPRMGGMEGLRHVPWLLPCLEASCGGVWIRVA